MNSCPAAIIFSTSITTSYEAPSKWINSICFYELFSISTDPFTVPFQRGAKLRSFFNLPKENLKTFPFSLLNPGISPALPNPFSNLIDLPKNLKSHSLNSFPLLNLFQWTLPFLAAANIDTFSPYPSPIMLFCSYFSLQNTQHWISVCYTTWIKAFFLSCQPE